MKKTVSAVRDSRASKPCAGVKITPREKGETRQEAPHHVSRLSFLAWRNFHARSRFACSTIPEGKWGHLFEI